MKIDSFYDLKNNYDTLMRLGNKIQTPTTFPQEFYNYMSYQRDFCNEGIRFLMSQTEFIIILADNGVLCFSPEGHEIYREIPESLDWKFNIIKAILKTI